MIFFKFSAVNGEMETIKSYIEAEDKQNAEEKLHLRGYNDISISKSISKFFISHHISSRDLSIMCRQMSAVISSDMAMLDGLLLICEQSDNSALEIALSNVYEKIKDDEKFKMSDALKEEIVFPVYMINLITLGESAGNLDEVFLHLAKYYEKDTRIKQKIKTAVTYPVILTILMIWVIVLLVVKILPMFDNMLKLTGGKLPNITRGFLNISSFLSSFGLYILLGIALLVIFFIWSRNTKIGKKVYDRIKLSIPGVSLLAKKITAAEFAGFLAMISDKQIPMDEAIDKLSYLFENSYLQEKLVAAKDKISTGTSVSAAIGETGIFPPMLLRMIKVGEKTGKLKDMLKKSADFYDEDVDEALLRLTGMIEPILIIILSIIIGVVLLSLMLPLINIMRAI